MKYIHERKVRIITGNNPAEFEDATNRVLAELAQKQIEADLVIETNWIDIKVPEDKRDEANLKGFTRIVQTANSSRRGATDERSGDIVERTPSGYAVMMRLVGHTTKSKKGGASDGTTNN